MKQILNRLFNHQSLTREESAEVMKNIGAGMYNESQIAAFISVYLMRSIELDELIGFRDALMSMAIPMDLSDFDPIDIVGTGGDEKNTFNISTCSCFVLAGAGYKVAKHGNYGATSISGSSNVLEYYGAKFTTNVDVVRRSLEKSGFAYLHAPFCNPAMKNLLLNAPLTIGASGSVFGLLLAFGWLFPETRLMMLFIPVPIKARIFVLIYGVAELFLGVANFTGDNVAHFAHLGGMLFGWLLIFIWKKRR